MASTMPVEKVSNSSMAKSSRRVIGALSWQEARLGAVLDGWRDAHQLILTSRNFLIFLYTKL